MLHEYALEPAILANWQCACRMAESFGFHHGRLIARLPEERQWGKLVAEAASPS